MAKYFNKVRTTEHKQNDRLILQQLEKQTELLQKILDTLSKEK